MLAGFLLFAIDTVDVPSLTECAVSTERPGVHGRPQTMPTLQDSQGRYSGARRAVLLPVSAAALSSLPRHAAHVNEATTSPHRRAAAPE